MHAQSFTPVQLFATPYTTARQAPLSMEFPRQGHWSGLPFPPRGSFLTWGGTTPPALAGGFFTSVAPGKPLKVMCLLCSTQKPHPEIKHQASQTGFYKETTG